LPNACIGVDVIVGFPGESEEDFLETYDFLNQIDISYLHVFTYSERANTPAAEMPEVVPIKTRHLRSKMLRNLSVKKRRLFYEKNLGAYERVLFENDIENGYMYGFTSNYIRVVAKYDPMLINETMTVRLKNINKNGYMEIEETVSETAL
jgi:threonylcarbamoyladenosine tRNA methylthiotransferase MtaB